MDIIGLLAPKKPRPGRLSRQEKKDRKEQERVEKQRQRLADETSQRFASYAQDHNELLPPELQPPPNNEYETRNVPGPSKEIPARRRVQTPETNIASQTFLEGPETSNPPLSGGPTAADEYLAGLQNIQSMLDPFNKTPNKEGSHYKANSSAKPPVTTPRPGGYYGLYRGSKDDVGQKPEERDKIIAEERNKVLPEERSRSRLDNPVSTSQNEDTLSRIREGILAQPDLNIDSSQDAEHAVMTLIERLQAAIKEIDELKGARKLIDGLKKELEEAFATVETLQAELRAKRKDLIDSDKDLADNEQARRKLRDEKNAFIADNTVLIGEKAALARKLEALEQSRKQDQKKFEDKIKKDMDSLKATNKRLESELKELRKSHQTTLEGVRETYRREKVQTQVDHKEDLRKAEANASSHRYNLEQGYKATIERMNYDFSIQMGALDKKFQQAAADALNERYQLELSHRAKTDQMNSGFANERAGWERSRQNIMYDNNQRLQKAGQKHEEETAALRTSNANLVTLAEEEKTKLLQDFQVEKERIEQEHIAHTAHLQHENEWLKGQIVARPHIKGLTDPEVAARFQQLASDVDEFSRIRWESDKESHWPYPGRTLNRSENQKRLKKQIIQTAVWTILYQNVFRTPFQVFGEEGQQLYRAWTNEYGRNRYSTDLSPWPEPTEESENWRYEKIKELTEALGKATRGPEDRQKNQCYDKSVSHAAEEIFGAVGTVSWDSDLSAAKEIVVQAAKFWLDVGSQHYRMLVVLPHSSENVLKGVHIGYKTIELVTKPELRRIGDAQGQDLGKEEVVRGCQGEHSRYEPR